MALKWLEGFEHYGDFTLSDDERVFLIADKWVDLTVGDGDAVLVDGRATVDTFGLKIAAEQFYETDDLGDDSTWIVGFGIFNYDLDSFADLVVIRSISAVIITGSANDQAVLRLTTGGLLQVRSGDGTILGTSGFALSLNLWYYIEIKTTISSTSAWEVRVVRNGVSVGTFSGGGDTDPVGTGTANAVRFAGKTTSGDYDIDDIYVCDGSGSFNIDFLGDVKIIGTFPTASGDESEWISNTTSTDWQILDTSSPPIPTDQATENYVFANTAGDISLFSFGDFDNGNTDTIPVYGVEILSSSVKTSAGDRRVKDVIKASGTNFEGMERVILDNYTYTGEIHETNPFTGALWLKSEVDDSQYGFKLES